MWYTSPVLSSGIASASRREGRCLAYMTSALMAPLQPVHFINDLLPVTSCRQAQPRLHCLERAVRIQPLTITPTVRPRQSSFIMLTVSTFRASCKPGLRGSGNRLVATVNRPVRYVCYAQQDPVKTAEDIINKGIDVLKQIDGDKLKAAAAQAGTTVQDLKAQAGAVLNTSAGAIKQCIDSALSAWNTYDLDKDGKLTITEAVALLNSKELSDAVKAATGIEHTKRTEADIKKWSERADFDHSGTLSKREFVVMYVGLLADKAKLGAGGLASAVCAALDSDADGKIGSSELKKLLAGSGLTLLSNVANMIPDGREVDYRTLLAKVH